MAHIAQPKLPRRRRKREVKELTKIGYQGVHTYQHNITDPLDCSTKPVRVLCGSVRVRKTKMVFDQTQRVFILEYYFRTQLYSHVREMFQERFPNVRLQRGRYLG